MKKMRNKKTVCGKSEDMKNLLEPAMGLEPAAC